MVEESDKSDSWGNLLLNGILNLKSKIHHVSEKKSDTRNNDQDKHLLIGSKRPKVTKEVSENMVTKKVVKRLHSNEYKSENKFTSTIIEFPDWCNERQKKGYSQRII